MIVHEFCLLGKDAMVNTAVSKQLLPAALLTAIAFLVAGCPQSLDTTAIKSFAENTVAAGASFDSLAGDFYGNCIRQNEYTQKNFSAVPILPPTTAPAVAPIADQTMAPISTAITDDKDCSRAFAVSERWQLYNHGLIAYVKALGALAGVNVKPGGLDALSGELSSVKFIDEDTSKKAATFGTTIAAWVFQGQQKTSIATAVQTADAPLHAMIHALMLAATNYNIKLTNEGRSLRLMYEGQLQGENTQYTAYLRAGEQTVTRKSYPRTPSGDAAFAAAIDRQDRAKLAVPFMRSMIASQRNDWTERANALDKRHRAASDYLAVLNDIDKTQTDLNRTAASGGSLAELYAIVNTYASDVETDVDSLSKHSKT